MRSVQTRRGERAEYSGLGAHQTSDTLLEHGMTDNSVWTTRFGQLDLDNSIWTLQITLLIAINGMAEVNVEVGQHAHLGCLVRCRFAACMLMNPGGAAAAPKF